eukprot:scaffold147773_cov34-Prasinocladus_malaysianus.AAC.2
MAVSARLVVPGAELGGLIFRVAPIAICVKEAIVRQLRRAGFQEAAALAGPKLKGERRLPVAVKPGRA